MQSAAEYLDRTRSAVTKLFEGIDGYSALLSQHSVTFVTSYADQKDFQRQYTAWCETNRSTIQAALEAQKQYLGEIFAKATLGGSILQLGAKAIECYSKNTEIPDDWKTLIKPGNKSVPFCIGRLVRGVPLGLVIYAGRNQYTHFEDKNLREPNVEVFRRLAMNHGHGKGSTEPVVDPAFDLQTESINSYADNVIALLEWRSVEAYESDIRNLLQI